MAYVRHMAKLSIIPDTNALLHFRRPDQIDWNALAHEADVEIVLTSVVLRELDKHKNQHSVPRVRDRARDLSEWLRRIRRGTGHASPRPIVFFLDEPKVLPKHLDPDVPDDRLVATALAYAASGHAVAVFTDDTLLSFKLEQNELREINPTPDIRLKEATSPDQAEIQKLRTEIARLTNRLPALHVELLGSADVVDLAIPSWLAAGPKEPEAIRREHPQLPTRATPTGPGFEGLARTGFSGLRPADVDTYNQKLNAFYAKYDAYFSEWQRIADRRRWIVPARFVLRNTGTATATHVAATLQFTRPQFQLLGAVPDYPEPPQPPAPPTAFQLAQSLSLEGSRFVRPRAWSEKKTQDIGLLEIDLDLRKNRVELSTHRLQHGSPHEFATVLVEISPDVTGSAGSVEIEIAADELPTPHRQKLVLKVTEDPEAPQPRFNQTD